MVNVYGGNGGFCTKKFSFLKLPFGSSSMFINAWFIKETESSSSSDLGGISKRASRAEEKFLIVYSIAAFKLNASIRADYFKAWEFPTDFTYIPGALEPTPSYGCFLTPY